MKRFILVSLMLLFAMPVFAMQNYQSNNTTNFITHINKDITVNKTINTTVINNNEEDRVKHIVEFEQPVGDIGPLEWSIKGAKQTNETNHEEGYVVTTCFKNKYSIFYMVKKLFGKN